MKKDNFDIRAFLAENKLTENSRGDEGRYHFDGSQKNSGCIRMLSEMRMPADPAAAEEGLDEGDPYDHHDPDYNEDWFSGAGADQADDYNDAQKDAGVDECGDVPNTTLDRLTDPNLDPTLEEAGYTDDDDEPEFGDDDDDISLMNMLGKDKGAAKARKAFDKDAAVDAADDEPVDDEPVDPAMDDEEPAPEAGAADAPVQAGLSSKLHYNPELVEFEMSPEELDQYLSSFRRPEVATKFLDRALKAAQQEVNDSARKHMYLVLKNGFYETSNFIKNDAQLIATINKDPNYKGWED